MAISSIKAAFCCDVQRVWDVVTSLEDYGWRSDVSRIETVNEGRFVEYTKNGFATTFDVTVKELCQRYEFQMENENMKGHWTGLFSWDGEKTTVEFTEDVTAKKAIMKPFVKAYLKKQQAQYIADLKKALE